MNKFTCWIDYLFLLVCGILLLSSQGFQPEKILYILIALLLIAPPILFPNKLGIGVSFVGVFLTGVFAPEICFFLPSIFRITGRYFKKKEWLVLIGLLNVFFMTDVPFFIRGVILCLSVFASYLCVKEQQIVGIKNQLVRLKDDSWEQQELLKNQNEQLVQSQETMLDLEIAEERNRIARDIHDNVGHLLSSAIIQLGALETVTQDGLIKEKLKQLKNTVHRGMDNVRESVHDLHAESLQLEKAIDLLLADFHFCEVTIDGHIPPMLSKEQEKMILMVITEALSNVMKHSQATQVSIIFDELPAFYRVKIADNGVGKIENSQVKNGIGLASMRERVQKRNGQLHIRSSKEGFQITIILLKESTNDTSSSGG